VNVLKALLLIIVPVVLFWAGAVLMSLVCERNVESGLRCTNITYETPLNQRLCGYKKKDVFEHWGRLEANGRCNEKCFLGLDLLFPLLYGSALLASLIVGRALLGRPFGILWVVFPVAIIVVADWIENLVHLSQLKRFVPSDLSTLQPDWIQIASLATAVKLWVLIGTSIFLLILSAFVLFRK
jgi:hypothetical protein